jgi:hypothetical protein
MDKSGTIALDAGIAVGLLIALMVVYFVDTAGSGEGTAGGIKGARVTDPHKVEARPLRLAVTPKVYDDVGSLLEKLGKGFDKYTKITDGDLRNLPVLKDFDVIFLTCAQSTPQDIHQNEALRKYVDQGGTLYVSDWRFDALRGAFPEYIDPEVQKNPLSLKAGRVAMIPNGVKAKVIDPGLREVLGPEVMLGFESPGWKPAAFRTDKVTVGMQGSYMSENFGPVQDAPLLVKFRFGKGNVVFTSFHNSRQVTEVTTKLLNYLVFHAVTARAESEQNEQIVKGGFEPARSSLVSASASNPKVTKTYTNKKGGKLLFALAFNPDGKVKLRLTVRSPDGERETAERATPFTIEIPNARVGEWEYTVEAIGLENPNFPFTVTVAEPK